MTRCRLAPALLACIVVLSTALALGRPVYGEATFDRVRFGILCGEGSKLQWDPDRKAMLLRGTMGPQYVLSAYVDNVEIDCFSPEPAESRGSAP